MAKFIKMQKSWTIPKEAVPEEIVTPQDLAKHLSLSNPNYTCLLNRVSCLKLNMEGAALTPYLSAIL